MNTRTAKETPAAQAPAYNSEVLVDLVEVGKVLTSTLDPDEILDRIMHKVSQLIEAENWSLLLKDEETGELVFKVVVGAKKNVLDGIRLPRGEGIAGCAAENGTAEFVPDAQSDPRLMKKIDRLSGFTTRSIFCVPMKIHGKILGVIEIVNVEDVERFKTQNLPILTILADYAAIAIENGRLFSRIERMSVTDEYTGLYNARYLYRTLDIVLRRAGEKGKPAAVVFMDIDNFKELVDSRGHLLGSRALKEIGTVILNALNREDILIKYGGDEYVIILPENNKEETRKIIERVRRSVRENEYLISTGRPVRVTASFGAAFFPEDGRDATSLLLAADRRMYLVKNSAKDGISM